MVDLTGQKFGRLIVVGFSYRKGTHYYWVCRCECGNTKVVERSSLTTGHTKSCGCYRRERTIDRNTVHGSCRRGLVTKTYMVWQAIIARCTNPRKQYYNDYGGRGIKVCERWLKFENFYSDVGDIPDGMTIDRIDNDGDYKPGNWRFATSEEQQNNTRSNRWIEYGGRRMTLSQSAKAYHLNVHTLKSRLDQLGWSIERSLTQPVKRGRKEHAYKEDN